MRPNMISSAIVALQVAKISIIMIGIVCNLIALSVYYYSRKVHFHQYNNSGGNYVINLTITGLNTSLSVLENFLGLSSIWV